MGLSSPVLLVALRVPILLGPVRDVDTGPHIARVFATPGNGICTPQPACGAGGEGRTVSQTRESPGPVDLAMKSSAFFLVENRFTSASVPTG